MSFFFRTFCSADSRLTHTTRTRFDLSDDVEQTPLVTHARHRHHLSECLASLVTFLGASRLLAGESATR